MMTMMMIATINEQYHHGTLYSSEQHHSELQVNSVAYLLHGNNCYADTVH